MSVPGRAQSLPCLGRISGAAGAETGMFAYAALQIPASTSTYTFRLHHLMVTSVIYNRELTAQIRHAHS